MKNWITQSELEQNMVRRKIYVALDHTAHAAFQERHLPNSAFLSLKEDLTGTAETGEGRHPLPDMTDFADRIMALGIGADTPVLLYSDGMTMAMYRLWWMLKAIGVKDIVLLYDAAGSWKAFSTHFQDPRQSKNRGSGLRFDENWIAKMDEVQAHVKKQDVLLIDSRDKNRFDGIEDTMDHVPGHIPTAVNYPYEELIRDTPPTKEEIEEHFRDLTDQPLVVYCGSGVSAPWNILLLDEIGRPSKLYPGSFSDWITNKENKIEK